MLHNISKYLKNSPGRTGRRCYPRIPASGAFCTEITEEDERFAIVSDVSPTGLRLHRPYRGKQPKTVQLEFDVPGVDELIWAKGWVCFDRVWRSTEGHLLQTTGIEIATAAERHLRLLREYTYAHARRFGHYAERRADTR